MARRKYDEVLEKMKQKGEMVSTIKLYYGSSFHDSSLEAQAYAERNILCLLKPIVKKRNSTTME